MCGVEQGCNNKMWTNERYQNENDTNTELFKEVNDELYYDENLTNKENMFNNFNLQIVSQV